MYIFINQMRNIDMRISNNLLQEQPHARRTGDMWDIPFSGGIHGAAQCSRIIMQPVSRKAWSTHQEKQGPSLMLMAASTRAGPASPWAGHS